MQRIEQIPIKSASRTLVLPIQQHIVQVQETAMSTANTRGFITRVFNQASESGFGSAFLDHLASDVVWHATGSSPLAGVYNSKQSYIENVLARLRDRVEHIPPPTVDRILVDGEWAAVHWHTVGATGKNGRDFSMDYMWLLRVEERETEAENPAEREVKGLKIVEVVGFYDQGKMRDVFEDRDKDS